MIRTVVLDVGETLTRDDRHRAGWADWLGVPRHTLSGLVGAVVVDGRDNADAIRLLRPDIDVAAEYAAREAAGRGERLDETDLYVGDHPANDVFPAAAVGLLTAHLRRGPWGHWWADDETVRQVADYSIDSLFDLPDLPGLPGLPGLVNPGRRGGSHG
ncbi:hypothetical protein ABZW32_26185 [Streptomyces sp. NPDC004667]|uniref:hypothetical protein n=1 Tax=Streptomyces sp. NPDC004667 TaxID=3154285 RepID=UPI0033A2CC94